MSLLHSEYRDRLAHWQRVLASDFYRPLESIQFDGFTTIRHLTPGQAAQGPFCPMEEGTAWGHTWEYMWCRADITLPEAAADKTVAMELDLGGEATLFVNGKAFGTRRAEWVSVPHHYICDNILTHCAQPGERFSLLFEVYAGHYFPDVGGCSTGPVLPGTLQDPAAEGCRSRMGRNTFGIWNENAYQLWMDVSTLSMLMDELPEDSLRASQIADGGSGQFSSGSGLAVAYARDSPKDGAYICRPAASFGTISGIPLYPKPAGRLRDVPGALPRAV